MTIIAKKSGPDNSLDFLKPKNQQELLSTFNSHQSKLKLFEQSPQDDVRSRQIILKLLRMTGAEKLVSELLELSVQLDNATGDFIEMKSNEFSDTLCQKLDKHGLKYYLTSNKKLISFDTGQEDFFTNLEKAVKEKRFEQRRKELNPPGSPGTAGELNKIMKRRIAEDVDKELWGDLQPAMAR